MPTVISVENLSLRATFGFQILPPGTDQHFPVNHDLQFQCGRESNDFS
jgi:hypothetical protein